MKPVNKGATQMPIKPTPQLLLAGPHSGSKPLIYATDVTMVDWVAKDALCSMMQGIMQAAVYSKKGHVIAVEGHPDPKLLAKNAYVLADAFVAEKLAREQAVLEKLAQKKAIEAQKREQAKQ